MKWKDGVRIDGRKRREQKGLWGQTIPSDGVYCLCCH